MNCADIQSMTQQRQNPLSDFKVTDAAQAGQQILDELRAVKELVTAKATPEEASAFGQWLAASAQAAADAAKEGGLHDPTVQGIGTASENSFFLRMGGVTQLNEETAKPAEEAIKALKADG